MEWVWAAVAMAVVAGLVLLLVTAVGALRPPLGREVGVRYEPPPTVGAPVLVWGNVRGVITAEVAYGDGPRWQVRLSTGRYVVVYRYEFVVLERGGG